MNNKENIERELLVRGGYSELNAMQKSLLATPDSRVILLAPTGSGKTVAFLGWLMQRVAKPKGSAQALIIAPVRELAQQIANECKRLFPGYRTAVLCGGHKLTDEANSLASAPPDLIVATPGRFLDHLQRDNIVTETIGCAIIDEMDKCLDLGFMPDIRRIIKQLPRLRYILMASATMPDDTDVEKIFRGKYDIVDFRDGESAGQPDIEVVEIPTAGKDKLPDLISLLNHFGQDSKSIVFVNHRESAERVYSSLRGAGFPVSLYHGALEQDERELAVASLRNGVSPVMIATDLASRGLDIPAVDNVVHYHLPISGEVYTHRNGRTARAGASGTVYILTNPDEVLPEYAESGRKWYPSEKRDISTFSSPASLVVFNLGKRDKISRGDILGFLTKQMEIPGEDIGKIDVSDRYSSAVISNRNAEKLLNESRGLKMKNKRFTVRKF